MISFRRFTFPKMASAASEEVEVGVTIAQTKAFKIACLDMDGTLLNGHHRLSQRSINTLRRLSGRGFMVSIATGRAAPSVIEHLQELSLPQSETFVVCYNGTWCLRVTGTETSTLFTLPICNDHVRLLLGLTDKLGLLLQFYDGLNGEVLVVPKTDEHRALMKRYADLVGKPQIVLNSTEEMFERSPAGSAKLLVLTNNPDELIEAANIHLPPGTFHIIKGSPWPFFVEFLPAGSSKGKGVKTLCEMLNIPLDEVVAFGDGDNDCEMLSWVGHGCAMANANDKVKAAASHTLQHTNDEDGCVRELERLESLGLLHLPLN